MPYMNVVELPVAIANALKEIGYTRRTIELQAVESTNLNCSAGDGYKAFVIIVDLVNASHKITEGSWGGSNPYAQTLVDDYRESFVIPENVAVIKGNRGEKCFATIYLSPKNMINALPPATGITKRQYDILATIKSYTSAYRKEVFQRMGVKDEEFLELVSNGFLKKQAKGYSITAEGKNAVEWYKNVNSNQ